MRYPPIASLRALEAAARHLSYTKAAQELHVTQSAISHQIHHAEALLGLKLFERQGRRPVLTENGQALVPIVRDFLERIRTTVEELSAEASGGSLRVSLLPSFAFKWLVPRLGHFNAKHPDIEVWIATSEELINFNQGQADMGIRLGHGDWPGLKVIPLLREYVFPVCSPRFLRRHKKPRTPEDLLNYPLLRRYTKDITPRWRDWFRDAGVKVKKLPRGTQFSDTSMAIQAALDDQGIALARSAHVSDDLAAGRLVKLFDIDSTSKVAYFVVYPLGKDHHPPIKAFRDWLLEEAVIAQKEFDFVVGKAVMA